jgi:hypothetical protein
MTKIEKEKEISENCFVKERDDIDQIKITENKKSLAFLFIKCIRYFDFIKKLIYFR